MSGSNLVILAGTSDKLSRGQARDLRPHGQTQATTIPEGQNWPWVKMRLKLVLWDNFTSSPEIIHFILFSSDNSFVLRHCGKLMFIVTIFNPSDCCLYSMGTRYPPHVSFVTTLQGGNVPRT